MEQWMIRSNIETFGYYEAARILRKRRLNFEQAYFAIFGCTPRGLSL